MDDQKTKRPAQWWQFALAIALLPSAVICWLLALGIAAGPGQHYSDFWQLVVVALLGAGDDDADAPLSLTLEIEYDRIQEMNFIRDLAGGQTLPFHISRFDELIGQLFEFRRHYITGNCR